MASYPIHITRDPYRGRDPRKRQKAADHNRDVAELERKINEILCQQTEPIKVYDWFTIAQDTGFPFEFVKKVGYSIEGGSNGFTANGFTASAPAR